MCNIFCVICLTWGNQLEHSTWSVSHCPSSCMTKGFRTASHNFTQPFYLLDPLPSYSLVRMAHLGHGPRPSQGKTYPEVLRGHHWGVPNTMYLTGFSTAGWRAELFFLLPLYSSCPMVLVTKIKFWNYYTFFRKVKVCLLDLKKPVPFY